MSSAFGAAYVLVIFHLYVGPICSEKENKKPEVLLCRQCGHSIVDGREVVDIKSALALKYKNVSVFNPKGTLVQTFQNPQGMSFDVITVSKANILEAEQAYVQHSWFPGYAWKVAGCPRCQTHLGWTFSSTEDDDIVNDYDHDEDDEKPSDKYQKPKQYSFAGLVLSRLIRESSDKLCLHCLEQVVWSNFVHL